MLKTPLAKVALGTSLVVGAITLASTQAAADDPYIAPSAEETRPLLVGAEVPAATLRQIDGTEVSLRDHIAGEKSILIFYRGGW